MSARRTGVADLTCWGLFREREHSPGRESDDAASSARYGSASRSCSENDPRACAGYRAPGFISGALHPVLDGEEGGRTIWRGCCRILGASEGHFRQGNRESPAVPEVIPLA